MIEELWEDSIIAGKIFGLDDFSHFLSSLSFEDRPYGVTGLAYLGTTHPALAVTPTRSTLGVSG